MKVETKFNPGDEVFYIEEVGEERVPCPACNGTGKIVGADGNKYKCSNSQCFSGMMWNRDRDGIEVGEIFQINIYIGKRSLEYSGCESIYYAIKTTGIYEDGKIDRDIDSRRINGNRHNKTFTEGALYKTPEEITPKEFEDHKLTQSMICGTCKTRNY